MANKPNKPNKVINIKFIKPNNFHTYMEEFRITEGENFTYDNVHIRMIRAGYSFSQMSSEQWVLL